MILAIVEASTLGKLQEGFKERVVYRRTTQGLYRGSLRLHSRYKAYVRSPLVSSPPVMS